MLSSRSVSGVNHKRSAGPNAQWTSSLGSEHGHCSPRDVWDVGAVSVHVCSDGRPTCTQRIPEVPSRYQAFKKVFFFAVLTQGRRSRLGSFRSGFEFFFALAVFVILVPWCSELCWKTQLNVVYHYWCTRSSSMQMPACLHALFSIPKFNLLDSDNGRPMSNW